MRLFYIEPSAAVKSPVEIKGAEAHHMKNVLRLKPGDPIKLFDGTGFEYEAVIVAIGTEAVAVEIRRKFRSTSGTGPRILVAQAFLKEKKMDDLVRRLSELGISGWFPFFCQRSIPLPDKDRLAGRISRWQRIAIEAMKQCRRKTLLEIHQAHSLEEMLKIAGPLDLKIVFWENEALPFRFNCGPTNDLPLKSIIIMLGPEGGFTEPEIQAIRQSGFVSAGLGPRILRAETATLAASTLVQYLYGDMGPKARES